MMTHTEREIARMLREDTGRHFLDSGLVGGRHWERNILLTPESFAKAPAATVEFGVSKGTLDIDYTRSVFHFLRDNLEYDPDMTRAFDSFSQRSGEGHYEAARLWLEECGFQYHDFNSCNQISNLSQIIQFCAFGQKRELASFEHVILQVHNGCDARGGYTRPRVFTLTNEGGIYTVANGYIRCDGCGTFWETDDDSHWYHKGCCGLGAGTRLELYDFKSGEDCEENSVVVTEDCEAFCPMCGEGRLTA